jgi:hypothetical protein
MTLDQLLKTPAAIVTARIVFGAITAASPASHPKWPWSGRKYCWNCKSTSKTFQSRRNQTAFFPKKAAFHRPPPNNKPTRTDADSIAPTTFDPSATLGAFGKQFAVHPSAGLFFGASTAIRPIVHRGREGVSLRRPPINPIPI